MIPRRSRLALWSLGLLLAFMLFGQGRLSTEKAVDSAPLFRPGPGTIAVRLAGSFPRPGVYLLPAGATVATAIKMTLAEPPAPGPWLRQAGRRLVSGSVVTLGLTSDGTATLALSRMHARECMLLGIPLDPDLLGADEWCLLPGLGPVLAQRIVDDRQSNGVFGGIEGILRVSGVGLGKLAGIERFF